MKIILLLVGLSVTCLAQHEPCGLRSIADSTELTYPPLAKAAHVGGTVILMASFGKNGEVENVDVLSGPAILHASAKSYVEGFHANEYGGPRNCPIVIHYAQLSPAAETPRVSKVDLQHITIEAPFITLSDPAPTLGKLRKRFWLF